MNKQEKEIQLTTLGKKLILFGVLSFIILFITTFFLGAVFTPLQTLQLRLAIVGIGMIYTLIVFFYIHRSLNKIAEKGEEKTFKQVIISFNGKELGKM